MEESFAQNLGKCRFHHPRAVSEGERGGRQRAAGSPHGREVPVKSERARSQRASGGTWACGAHTGVSADAVRQDRAELAAARAGRKRQRSEAGGAGAGPRQPALWLDPTGWFV